MRFRRDWQLRSTLLHKSESTEESDYDDALSASGIHDQQPDKTLDQLIDQLSRMTTNPQQQTVTITTSSNDNKLIADPLSFDGKSSEYQNFKRSLTLYFRFYADKYPTDTPAGNVKKQLAVLSKLKSGPAQQWANRQIDTFDPKPDNEWPTWDEFMKQLDATFDDHNARDKACDKLDHFYQHNHSIDMYFNTFELIADEAGIMDDFGSLKHYIIKGVKHKIIDPLVRMKELPDNYSEFKAEIIRVGRLNELQDAREAA